MSRLNKRECYLLARAADFALAGEWPWEDDADVDAEMAHLERAVAKLRKRIPEAYTIEAQFNRPKGVA